MAVCLCRHLKPCIIHSNIFTGVCKHSTVGVQYIVHKLNRTHICASVETVNRAFGLVLQNVVLNDDTLTHVVVKPQGRVCRRACNPNGIVYDIQV